MSAPAAKSPVKDDTAKTSKPTSPKPAVEADKKAEVASPATPSSATPASPVIPYDPLRAEQLMHTLMADLHTQKPADMAAFIAERIKDESFVHDDGECDPIECHYTCPPELNEKPLSIVVLGASGDLAKKKTFPALFTLFRDRMLPSSISIVGYARSKMTDQELQDRLRPYLPKDDAAQKVIESFFNRLSYVAGPYDQVAGFENLDKELCATEKTRVAAGVVGANRIFYLALPPTAFVSTCEGISGGARPKDGWIRVVVEKPFGHNTKSSAELSTQLAAIFKEEQLYRIDHYLGKEMVQNIVTLRFANHIFSALWNKDHIANVQITFKEMIGTQGRGGYFDNFGIIRDVIQNHLTQILALIAMEKPRSLGAEDIRDEKVAVLKCVEPVTVDDCVLGQYTQGEGEGAEGGYLDDPTVPKGSVTPTFASMVLKIKNDRWDGVPFIIKAGKALEQKAVTIRIQFRDEIRPFLGDTQRNELVIRAQPSEAMYVKVSAKAPGMGQKTVQTELDLTYNKRYNVRLPEAYESLINEVVNGNTTNFVRVDELDAAWRIYTPLLEDIAAGKAKPVPYVMGSRGPAAADEMVRRKGFVRSEGYNWQSPTTAAPAADAPKK